MALNFKNTALLVLLLAAGYYCYDLYFGELQTGDVAKLIRMHRRAEPGAQALLKHKIMSVYSSLRDYPVVLRALDSPSPTTQRLAVQILAEKVERRALPKLLEMLDDAARPEPVKQALATAMGNLGITKAIPRLVELTDAAEAQSVRVAAHHALLKLTNAGGQVKLGANTREQWTLWLRSRQVSGIR